MPQYTLTLKWTDKGANPNHPHSVQHRRNKAKAVANSKQVTGWDGTPVKDTDITPTQTGAIWKVQGEDSKLKEMISTWEWFGNVKVSGGPA
jgi:hypothetical protein